VLEAIPSPLAAEVTAKLCHPDHRHRRRQGMLGQVLVLHDMLDISAGKKARSSRTSWPDRTSIAGAIAAYVAAVKDGSFPARNTATDRPSLISLALRLLSQPCKSTHPSPTCAPR
jgi:3-methyl-2-oxobutanoate hydroxymethyltransferase